MPSKTAWPDCLRSIISRRVAFPHGHANHSGAIEPRMRVQLLFNRSSALSQLFPKLVRWQRLAYQKAWVSGTAMPRQKDSLCLRFHTFDHNLESLLFACVSRRRGIFKPVTAALGKQGVLRDRRAVTDSTSRSSNSAENRLYKIIKAEWRINIANKG